MVLHSIVPNIKIQEKVEIQETECTARHETDARLKMLEKRINFTSPQKKVCRDTSSLRLEETDLQNSAKLHHSFHNRDTPLRICRKTSERSLAFSKDKKDSLGSSQIEKNIRKLQLSDYAGSKVDSEPVVVLEEIQAVFAQI